MGATPTKAEEESLPMGLGWLREKVSRRRVHCAAPRDVVQGGRIPAETAKWVNGSRMNV